MNSRFTANLLLLFGSVVQAQDYHFTTPAGFAASGGYVNGAPGESRFSAPHGIALDPQGNIFVTDLQNYVIRKVSVDGTVSTLAGANGVSGTQDGTGESARFAYPFGISSDRSGNLYVTEVIQSHYSTNSTEW